MQCEYPQNRGVGVAHTCDLTTSFDENFSPITLRGGGVEAQRGWVGGWSGDPPPPANGAELFSEALGQRVPGEGGGQGQREDAAHTLIRAFLCDSEIFVRAWK